MRRCRRGNRLLRRYCLRGCLQIRPSSRGLAMRAIVGPDEAKEALKQGHIAVSFNAALHPGREQVLLAGSDPHEDVVVATDHTIGIGRALSYLGFAVMDADVPYA